MAHSEETKKKISEARKLYYKNGGKPIKFWLGKKMTEEVKKKMSKGKKGIKNTIEHNQNISLGLKGFKKTEEHVRKIFDSRKNSGSLKHTQEWKDNHSKNMMKNQNPNWNGGSSFLPYSVDWTKTLRRSIRERDNYTCQVCGEEQKDIIFAVHHIDYNKQNCNPDNLITLCKSHHAKTNFNKNYWINYFKKHGKI